MTIIIIISMRTKRQRVDIPMDILMDTAITVTVMKT